MKIAIGCDHAAFKEKLTLIKHLNDKEIIKQVTGGLTPPMPSFEIDPINIDHQF